MTKELEYLLQYKMFDESVIYFMQYQFQQSFEHTTIIALLLMQNNAKIFLNPFILPVTFQLNLPSACCY